MSHQANFTASCPSYPLYSRIHTFIDRRNDVRRTSSSVRINLLHNYRTDKYNIDTDLVQNKYAGRGYSPSPVHLYDVLVQPPFVFLALPVMFRPIHSRHCLAPYVIQTAWATMMMAMIPWKRVSRLLTRSLQRHPQPTQAPMSLLRV